MQNIILTTKKIFKLAFILILITANFMSCKTAPEPKEETLIDLIKAGKKVKLTIFHSVIVVNTQSENISKKIEPEKIR